MNSQAVSQIASTLYCLDFGEHNDASMAAVVQSAVETLLKHHPKAMDVGKHGLSSALEQISTHRQQTKGVKHAWVRLVHYFSLMAEFWPAAQPLTAEALHGVTGVLQLLPGRAGMAEEVRQRVEQCIDKYRVRFPAHFLTAVAGKAVAEAPETDEVAEVSEVAEVAEVTEVTEVAEDLCEVSMSSSLGSSLGSTARRRESISHRGGGELIPKRSKVVERRLLKVLHKCEAAASSSPARLKNVLSAQPAHIAEELTSRGYTVDPASFRKKAMSELEEAGAGAGGGGV